MSSHIKSPDHSDTVPQVEKVKRHVQTSNPNLKFPLSFPSYLSRLAMGSCRSGERLASPGELNFKKCLRARIHSRPLRLLCWKTLSSPCTRDDPKFESKLGAHIGRGAGSGSASSKCSSRGVRQNRELISLKKPPVKKRCLVLRQSSEVEEDLHIGVLKLQ